MKNQDTNASAENDPSEDNVGKYDKYIDKILDLITLFS